LSSHRPHDVVQPATSVEIPSSESLELLATFADGGSLVSFRRVENGYYIHYREAR
jgi:hypothetical protein